MTALNFSLKTGEVLPKDLSFEEITSGHEVKFGTLGRRKSKLKLNALLEEENLFPKKRELDQAIRQVEAEIEKGNFFYLRYILCSFFRK